MISKTYASTIQTMRMNTATSGSAVGASAVTTATATTTTVEVTRRTSDGTRRDWTSQHHSPFHVKTGPRKRPLAAAKTDDSSITTTTTDIDNKNSKHSMEEPWRPRRIKKRYSSWIYYLWKHVVVEAQPQPSNQRGMRFWKACFHALLLVLGVFWFLGGSHPLEPSPVSRYNTSSSLPPATSSLPFRSVDLRSGDTDLTATTTTSTTTTSATASQHHHTNENHFHTSASSLRKRHSGSSSSSRTGSLLPTTTTTSRGRIQTNPIPLFRMPPVLTGESWRLVGEADEEDEDPNVPDYGALDRSNRGNLPMPVEIRYASYSDMLNHEATAAAAAAAAAVDEQGDDYYLEMDADYAHYYALDDDAMRGQMVHPDGFVWQDENDDQNEEETETTCRRVAEHRQAFPNCNDFHQFDYAGIGKTYETDFTYINHGAWREVFAMKHAYSQNQTETVAVKEIRFEKSGQADQELFEYVRIDALVAERLSPNPRTFDIYGFCGLSILSEYFLHGDMDDRVVIDNEDHDEDDEDEEEDNANGKVMDKSAAAVVVPFKPLSPEQKLVLALEMADGLALLHGYKNGMILHSDVQMGQFLLNADKTMLKLNDFNRAEFLLWDDSRQSYCQHRNGKGQGNWRSPEEYRNDGLTDKIDVWSLCNNMYALLTGEEPVPYTKGNDPAKLIEHGHTGHVDEKYLDINNHKYERVLALLIPRCWEYTPANRPSMFEIVEELGKAVSEMEQELGVLRREILQQL